MEILILGRGKSALSLEKELSINNNITFAIEDYEKLDNKSVYKKDVDINKYEIYYISPGVKNNDELLLKLKDNHKIISSELEYALDKLKNHKIIAITGSNGKTTVASLLHYVLNKKGIKNVVCGNIGDPLINYINVDVSTYIILEISSFQLERINNLKPYISIITNITPNHLDRHTFEQYIEIKKKIYLNQGKDEYLIINRKTYKEYKINTNTNLKIINNKRIKSEYLIGKHNQENISFVCKVLDILNIKNYKKIIKEFRGVKFRLEYLGKYNNTLIYNDAKSTTMYSTIEAIKSVGKNTLLIIGGRNKNIDYSFINDYKVKEIIIFGEEATKTHLSIKKFKDLKEIMPYLKTNINKYNVVLFSPGFTSFDLYNNYIERGEDFEKLIYENFKIE